MIVGTLGLQIFAQPLVSLFGLSDETARLCILAIRIISVGFLFAGWNIAIQGVFQALGCGVSSLVISLLRLCVVVLPLSLIHIYITLILDLKVTLVKYLKTLRV